MAEKALRGRRALVVGGSGGLGRFVALSLAEAGAAVTVHGGSSRERLDRTLGELEAAGAEADGFLLPLAGPRDAAALFRKVPDADLVACSWGPFIRAGLARTGPEDWERMALGNLAFPGALASAYVGRMAAGGFGRFLFFGGTATDAPRGYATTAAYSAAKAGIAVLVKSIAVEFADAGVSAAAVCPGFVDTEYLDDAGRAALRKGAPGGRLLDPREIAALAVALMISDAANGSVVALDAGLDLGKRRRT